jgi:para-nitrobenzyl esterase
MKPITAAAAIALAIAWTVPSTAAISGPVSTTAGLLEGAPGQDPAVSVFKGVAFAAPPVGELRWKAPAPVPAWQGVRRADQFGDDCTQAANGSTRGHRISEDCLNLNLWTTASAASERRPVMVWLHGGGGTGSASSPQFDGEALARKGVVLVTVNFRLGVLAGLAVPDLDKESGRNASGNYNVMDVAAALQWVHDNVANFGGDPGRVTLFGESAGAGMVDYVAMTPLAKGLFQRALAQSHVRYYKDPELFALPTGWISKADAETEGVKFMQATGARSLADLRAIPWEKLMDIARTTPAGGGHVVDGYVIPYNNGDTFRLGRQNDVSYLAGDNKDESGSSPDTAFDILISGKKPTTNFVATTKLSDYIANARNKFGKFTDEYLKLYPAGSDRESFIASSNAARDNARVSSWMWTQLWTSKATHPVYTYTWTHAPPGPNHDLAGAFHGSEIAYIFGHPGPQWTDDDQRISDLMMSYWVNYAAAGDPNGPGLARWPAWDSKNDEVMEIGDHFQPIPLADAAKIAFWKKFYAAQSGSRPPKGAYQARAVRE